MPAAGVHIGGQHRHAMRPSVADELRGRIKPHRLAAEQRRRERRWVVALQPCRHIHQQRETRRMRLRKAVFAEAANLVEDLFGELF